MYAYSLVWFFHTDIYILKIWIKKLSRLYFDYILIIFCNKSFPKENTKTQSSILQTKDQSTVFYV